ncbi:phage tail tape measure protein [Arthrobacter sp. 31Y]|uniref:phage tail tape measure protein n=1 Tax=Arthrobacter sp. 31Y TaxID=1115632 RepID=UPI000465AF62|nr:phage tail tape measure protein [Arthrobacter sp. 31Y]
MSERSVVVRLEAEVSKFVRGQEQAKKATEETAKAQDALGKAVDEAASKSAKGSEKVAEGNRKQSQSSEEAAKSSKKSEEASKADAEAKRKQADAAETVGKGLTLFGTSTVAALGASAKAAMDWESAWAGVTKTVDGSPAQMAELEGGLRNLARTLPSTHTEIAAVAEAAGQLGVKRQDILAFTKTMVDLGETTNLTAEEAATDIAQIANVMGTTGDEIDNFGATLVALGNDGASTEKDILSMAQRIAGAGKLVGATEADVLALSNTLASMGVKAELGGGVMTRVLLKMYSAVQGGGAKLDAFAKAAGTTAEDFAKKFSTSPVQALDLVTKGMARVKGEGGNVVAIMSEMGMKGTEEMQVMLSLAGAGDLLSKSLTLGSKAWEENTALLNEASKRYATTESKVKVAWNNIKDAAIDAGAVILPAISGIAESVSGLAKGFGDLPAPLQGAITGLGGVVGAAALAGGGLMLLLPKARDTISAFKELDTRADGSSRGLGKLGKAAGIAAGAFVGFEIIKSVHNSMQTGAKSTEELTQSLIKLSQQGDSLDTIFKDIGTAEFEGQIGSAGQALNKLVNQDFNSAVESFGATALGVDNGMAKISAAFKKTDEAIAGAATSGNTELAVRGFKAVADSAKEHGVSLEEVGKRFPNYLNALRAQANQAKVTVSETELLNWAMGEVPPAMKAAAAASGETAEKLIEVKGAAGQTIPITEDIAKALEEIGLNADGSIVSLDKFTQALLNTGMLQLSARDAARGWSQALLDLGLKADGTGGSIGALGAAFDNTTEQGIKNQAMFDGVAQAGIRNVEAMAKNKASNEEVQGALKGTYDGLIAAAGQFGITGEAAVDLAREVLGVPPGVSIDSWMDDEAKRMAQATTGELNKIDGRVVRTYTLHEEKTIKSVEYQIKQQGMQDTPSDTAFRPGTFAPARAGGGDLDMAPGPKGQDSQLFWGAKGEHVFTDREVDLMGGQQAVYQFRADLRAGNIPRHQNGGTVGSVGTVAAPSSFGGGSSTSVEIKLEVNGTTAPREVADEAMGILRGELMKQGVKLGGR